MKFMEAPQAHNGNSSKDVQQQELIREIHFEKLKEDCSSTKSVFQPTHTHTLQGFGFEVTPSEPQTNFSCHPFDSDDEYVIAAVEYKSGVYGDVKCIPISWDSSWFASLA